MSMEIEINAIKEVIKIIDEIQCLIKKDIEVFPMIQGQNTREGTTEIHGTAAMVSRTEIIIKTLRQKHIPGNILIGILGILKKNNKEIIDLIQSEKENFEQTLQELEGQNEK